VVWLMNVLGWRVGWVGGVSSHPRKGVSQSHNPPSSVPTALIRNQISVLVPTDPIRYRGPPLETRIAATFLDKDPASYVSSLKSGTCSFNIAPPVSRTRNSKQLQPTSTMIYITLRPILPPANQVSSADPRTLLIPFILRLREQAVHQLQPVRRRIDG